MLYVKIIIVLLSIYYFFGIILSMVAKIFSFLLEIPNLLCAIYLNYRKESFLKLINTYQFQSALENDIFLHYNFRALWNVTLSSGEGYSFGDNKDETISSALGRKFLERSLSYIGLGLYYFLYAVDFTTWKKGGHCIDAFRIYEYNKNNKQ